MKALFMAGLMAVPLGVWAEPAVTTAGNGPVMTSTGPNTQGSATQVPDPTQELKVMTERLGLTKEQQEKIAPILGAEAKDRKAVLADKSLSPQQKMVQGGMIHRAALQQIKAVFTPAQLALIEQGQDHPGESSTHP